MKKKKILFFLFSLSGGGAERTVINIMNNIDNQKYDIFLVLGTDKNSDYIDLVSEDINIIILNCSKLRYCLWKLAKIIRQVNPNLLFSTINANNIILILAKILSFARTPAVVREANNRTQSGKVTFINKIITRILYNLFSKKVIALSDGVKKDLVTSFHIKENKIKVIYNPVEVEHIRELSNEKITDINVNNSEKLIIAVGRFVEQKDFQTLIRAFKLVSEETNSRLILLGKGPLENELKQMVIDLEIESQVQFLGFKDNPYKYMKFADVFVLSSRWEGFGHVIVEAMATGTPIVSTDCNSGPKEIIGNNQYGLLAPVRDTEGIAKNIIELLQDSKMSYMYSTLGVNRSNRFSAESITREYEQIFNELIYGVSG